MVIVRHVQVQFQTLCSVGQVIGAHLVGNPERSPAQRFVKVISGAAIIIGNIYVLDYKSGRNLESRVNLH